MKKLFLPAIVVILSLAACQKEHSDVSPQANKPADEIMSFSSIDPGNPNNSYDSIGYYHNQLLDFYFQNGYNENTSEEVLLNMTNQFAQQDLHVDDFGTIEQNDSFRNIIAASNSDFTMDTLINKVNQDRATGIISDEAHDDMLLVISTIENNNSEAAPTLDDVENEIGEVENIEASVISSGMSSTDKEYVLAQTSVFRYSLVYWYDYSNSSQSDATAFSTESTKSLTKADLNTIAFADARGAQMALGTGAVEWATAFGGPAAGAAVLVAAAATFSANALYEIERH